METIDIIAKIEKFDFFRVFMTDPVTYKKLTPKAKLEWQFDLYRVLSIAYPVVMHDFNRIYGKNDLFDTGALHLPIIDALHTKLCRPGGRQPQWMFTKADPPPKVVGILAEYEVNVINTMMAVTGWEKKTLLWMNQHDKDNLRSMLNEYKEILSDKVKRTRSRKKS